MSDIKFTFEKLISMNEVEYTMLTCNVLLDKIEVYKLFPIIVHATLQHSIHITNILRINIYNENEKSYLVFACIPFDPNIPNEFLEQLDVWTQACSLYIGKQPYFIGIHKKCIIMKNIYMKCYINGKMLENGIIY